MPRMDRESRVIAASPARVWTALVDPGPLLAWLPPGEMTGRFERFEVRPGGSYRMVLTYPDASGAPGKATPDSDIVEARLVEIMPGERSVGDGTSFRRGSERLLLAQVSDVRCPVKQPATRPRVVRSLTPGRRPSPASFGAGGRARLSAGRVERAGR
ncbi:SRPBCC domain-containing protein [Amycolatopsis sp. NPDC051903]|uniref:SRPBCC domain-containing protein n=1 Tax=Amycolatopsis sp. NPDC051903 TaxID=3363936 RepID=UPI00379CAE7B